MSQERSGLGEMSGLYRNEKPEEGERSPWDGWV